MAPTVNELEDAIDCFISGSKFNDPAMTRKIYFMNRQYAASLRGTYEQPAPDEKQFLNIFETPEFVKLRNTLARILPDVSWSIRLQENKLIFIVERLHTPFFINPDKPLQDELDRVEKDVYELTEMSDAICSLSIIKQNEEDFF